MLRKGYIQREIEALGQILEKILFRKKERDFPAALTEVRTAAKSLAGLDLDRVLALPDDMLLTVLTSGDAAQGTARCLSLALLLREQASIYSEQGRPPFDSLPLHRKALMLLTEALLREESLRREEYQAQIDELGQKATSDEELPAVLQYRLVRYHEAMGQFGRAEDILYALREAGDSGAVASAAAFYRRLLTLPDDTLEAGGLPRDEVVEALAEVERG